MHTATVEHLAQLSKSDDSSKTEWRSLITLHHNVLLEGPEAATEDVLLLLKPHFREPIWRKQPGTSLHLPPGGGGTLILQDVEQCDVVEQLALFRWLGDSRTRTQTVSTATAPLFALVKSGSFDAALYYRLNVVLLRVERSNLGTHPHQADTEAQGEALCASDRETGHRQFRTEPTGWSTSSRAGK